MSATATTTTKINLEHVSSDDLIEELESRGHEVDPSLDLADYSDAEIENEYESRDLGESSEEMTRLYEAFKLGHTDRAMEIAKAICQEWTGRYL